MGALEILGVIHLLIGLDKHGPVVGLAKGAATAAVPGGAGVIIDAAESLWSARDINTGSLSPGTGDGSHSFSASLSSTDYPAFAGKPLSAPSFPSLHQGSFPSFR